MKRLAAAARRAAPLALVAALVAGAVLGAASLFDGDDEGGQAALALGPLESSWVSGQDSLAAYAEFAGIADPAFARGRERRAARERAVKALERRKVARKKQAAADARRKYEEAKRRAERLYRLALKRAAEQRKRQLARIRAAQARAERLRREREEKLKVRPGPECKLPSVRKRYACRTGRLPDSPAPKRK